MQIGPEAHRLQPYGLRSPNPCPVSIFMERKPSWTWGRSQPILPGILTGQQSAFESQAQSVCPVMPPASLLSVLAYVEE